MKKIVITGGTGSIGKELTKVLLVSGYEVVVLTRNPDLTNKTNFFWDPEKKEIQKKALDNVYALIHLAGANIAEERWTQNRKQELATSRIDSLNFLYSECEKINHFPKVLISSSAVGYYGSTTTNKIFKEEDAAAQDFLGVLCKDWEDATLNFKNKNTRTTILRTGVVLSSEKNGALQKMVIPFKFGLGAALGNGEQYIPWIHIDDIVQMYIYALETEDLSGVFNAVAPEHITNKEFSKLLAKTLNKSFWMPPVPKFILKVVLGEMQQILTEGSCVSADKIKTIGYKFRFTSLEKALATFFYKNQNT